MNGPLTEQLFTCEPCQVGNHGGCWDLMTVQVGEDMATVACSCGEDEVDGCNG